MLTPEWRKSTYSNGQANCIEVAGLWSKSSYSNSSSNCVEVAGKWHKSSHSNGQASCVEVRADRPDAVAVRDSKDRGGPELAFAAGAWEAFVRGVKQGQFDLA
jgi:Domain of unknown function (DUF397)